MKSTVGIQEGCMADLVVLGSNPIEKIENTKDIQSVINGGAVYSQKELIDAVPTDEQTQAHMNPVMEKFEKHGFSLEMFR